MELLFDAVEPLLALPFRCLTLLYKSMNQFAREDPRDAEGTAKWIGKLKTGDEQAEQVLFEKCLNRLKNLVRNRLPQNVRRVTDEEDIANSVLKSFFLGARCDRFPKLDDRNDLWQILGMLTRQKIVQHLRHMTRLKRGAGAVRGESVFDDGSGNPDRGGFDKLDGGGGTPAELFEQEEQLNDLLHDLPDQQLRDIALLKLNSHTNAEIAEIQQLSVRSIERKLDRIRKRWSNRLKDEPDADLP